MFILNAARGQTTPSKFRSPSFTDLTGHARQYEYLTQVDLKGPSRDNAGDKKGDEGPNHFTSAAYVAGLVKKQRSDPQRTIDRIEGGVPVAKGGRMGSKRNEEGPPLSVFYLLSGIPKI